MSENSRTLLSYLHRLAAPALADATLLARWRDQRDQDAFAALTARHGPMVFGVCRRILGDVQNAEDVFQATFVVLARKAAKLRRPEALASFLYGVAVRLARKARAAAMRRKMIQPSADATEPVDPRPQPLDVLSGRELLALIDAEMARLPEVYRLPLLLCLLQGRTVEEAARQLGCSIGSLRGRLERGREQLRRRLSRRGLGLSVGAVALLAPAAVSETLLAESLRHLSGPIPAAIGVLAGSAVSGLKWKIVCLSLFLLATAGLGMGASLWRTPAPETPAALAPPAAPAQAENDPRRDRYGDPLPEGAVARLGTLRFRLEFHQAFDLAFAPNGKTLAVASPVGLYLFDAATGRRMKAPQPFNTSFRQAAFSPDGKRLLAAVQDPRPVRVKDGFMIKEIGVQIWEVASGRKTAEVELKNILRLGWTAQGQPLVACQGEDAIVLHETATGRKQRFSAKDLSTRSFSYCHCAVGKKVLVAAGRESGVIHVWNLASGKERWAFKNEGFSLSNSLILSPDERWLASLSGAAEKNTLQLWDLTTGKARDIVAGDEQHLASVAFTADSKTLATVGQQEVRFWDTANGQERGRLKGEGRSFNPSAVSFAPDGKTLAAMEGLCGTIHLWDVATGECKPEAEGHSASWVRPQAFSPDGTRVATSGGLDGTIRVWEAATGRQLSLLRRSPSSVLDCAISADGRTLVSCWDDRLLLSDAATGRELHVLEANDWRRLNQLPNMSMHVTGDGRKAIAFRSTNASGAYSGGAGGSFTYDWLITCWDTAARKQLFRRQWAYHGSEREIAVSPDAAVFALPGTMREPMRLENVETGERLLTFPILKKSNIPLIFSADGRLLLSQTPTPAPPSAPDGSTRTLHLWEVLTASELLSLPISPSLCEAAVSADGRLLAAISPQREIILWDLKRDRELHRFKDFGSEVSSLAFSPDSRRLVSGLFDSTLLVWDVAAVRSKDGPAVRDAESVRLAWDNLAADARKAFAARWTLAAAPAEAMPLLTKHLHPAKAADPQRLRRLLADLESEQFAVREKAQEQLVKLGELAEPTLRRILQGKPTLEVRRRVQAVLERLHGPVKQAELLQSLRAVAVLEDIGTPAARRLLEELAAGVAEARLTREAKAALRRLDFRNSPSKQRKRERPSARK